MDAVTQNRQGEPLTFANAPTYVEDGVEFVDEAAGMELMRGLIAKRAELLERLARQ